MTRYLLDTGILNRIFTPDPPEPLAAWLDQQPDESLYICSMNLAAIWNSLLALAAGEKPSEQEGWFAGPRGQRIVFGNRVLNFDAKAGEVWAHLLAERGKAGQPCAPVDMMYAAIAEVNNCVLVTENEERFSGLQCFNPLRP